MESIVLQRHAFDGQMIFTWPVRKKKNPKESQKEFEYFSSIY